MSAVSVKHIVFCICACDTDSPQVAGLNPLQRLLKNFQTCIQSSEKRRNRGFFDKFQDFF